MESARIITRCILAAVLYGVVHDQVTVRVCLEYFTVYHAPIFGTSSPTFIALAWGVIATWWVGAIAGVFIAICARLGPRKLPAIEVATLINWLLLLMAVCAIVAGILGYREGVLPHEYHDMISPAMQHRFMADLWAHTASYASGIAGALLICILLIVKRTGAPRPLAA